MSFKSTSCIFWLNICLTSLFLLFSLSCSVVVKDGKQQPFTNQFLAENSMMKKRLPLIERENEVLKKENEQHWRKIQDLESQRRQLDLELASLGEKYINEKTLGDQEISSLQEIIQKNKEENSKNIDTLISQNKEIEAKLAGESHALKEQLITQKDSFNKEREQIQQEKAKRELEWSSELGLLKKKLGPMEKQISSLKLAINEISIQLGAATSLSEELRKSRDESLAELDSVKAANSNLNKKLAGLESVEASNVNLNHKLAELESIQAINADLNHKLAELKSIEATNANLNQKLAELSSMSSKPKQSD